jgi:tRNA1(Val) A37 N6-methylase TrmN6
MIPDRQLALGQFETPADVADLLLAFCLRSASDRALDPGCGRGAFLVRAAAMQARMPESGDSQPGPTLVGVELDPAAAAEARRLLPQAEILSQDFFRLQADPSRLFDAVVGNPPYTRAAWLSRSGVPADEATGPALSPIERQEVGRRAGLHAFFLARSARFLRPGGRLGFVVPNGWLDIAYGDRLKQFLLDHFKIVAIIESTAERWFERARVNTCLLVLERCADGKARSENQVRLALLRRPLAELIGAADRYRGLFRLVSRLLGEAERDEPELRLRLFRQAELVAADRWSSVLRGPALRRRRAGAGPGPLGAWATIQRGHTTGANDFFYLPPATASEWAIAPDYCRPLLKTLRGHHRLEVDPADCQSSLLMVESALMSQGVAAYVAWGESQGIHRRQMCQTRRRWFALPGQPPADLLLAKGIWRRHFAPLVIGRLEVDQQLYGVRLADGVPPAVAAALLNSSWLALQLELHGRVNFGHGVLWLAAYELAQLPLPDPRWLPARVQESLAMAFAALKARPVEPTAIEVCRDDRRALDEAVAEAVGLTPAELRQTVEALLDRLAARQRLAQNVARGS